MTAAAAVVSAPPATSGGMFAAVHKGLHAGYPLGRARITVGIELPLPQRDLHVKSWVGLTGDDARADPGQRGGEAASRAAPLAATTQAPWHTAHSGASNDAAHSVARDIAENKLTEHPDRVSGGMREDAASDSPSISRHPEGRQGNEQDN